MVFRRKRRRVKGPRSDGARAFDEWLMRHGITVPAFCDRHGLDRVLVQHAMSGHVRSVALDLAFAIQEGTNGDVSAHTWRASTVRWDADAPTTADGAAVLDKASGE